MSVFSCSVRYRWSSSKCILSLFKNTVVIKAIVLLTILTCSVAFGVVCFEYQHFTNCGEYVTCVLNWCIRILNIYDSS